MPELRPIDLARIAYQAYGASTGWLTFDGRRMPGFDDLGGSVTVAWTAAATAVERAVAPGFASGVADVPANSGRTDPEEGSN